MKKSVLDDTFYNQLLAPNAWDLWVASLICGYTTTPEPGATDHATHHASDDRDDVEGRIDPTNILHHIQPMDRLIEAATVRTSPPASTSPQTSTVDAASVNSASRCGCGHRIDEHSSLGCWGRQGEPELAAQEPRCGCTIKRCVLEDAIRWAG